MSSSFVDLCSRSLRFFASQHFQTASPPKPTGPIETIFHMELRWVRGIKVCFDSLSHMTCLKPVKDLRLHNRKGSDRDTLNVALRTQSLQKLFK